MGSTSNAEHPSVPSFASAEGLRAVLNRLHEAGPGAWRNDPEARELLLFAVQKYRRLALKWHRDEADAAHAAFLAMIASNTRRADDPWAIVTTAVSRTLKAETRADRHMISTERARHPQKLAKEPPVRAGEHEEFVFDILRAAPVSEEAGEHPDESGIAEAVRFLSALGWPADVAQAGVEYVTDRLASAGNRDTAFESLRRDASIPAQLDIPRSSWTKLVRLLLGGKTRPGVPSQRGILLRVVSGETAEVLLTDDALVLDVVEATGSGWLE
ncbi:hypothetical protein [Lacisediminihabitans profunda]|uniref:Uncharacterized protein n=1 Tax=Lacisediminihabitans profunda TaxID=2594790 RepID=A0A5C8UNJ5_9MICO|nr:hypothetical protein [Lacisediminihabitans profunda]TXN29803.1 hypothetical protein FVP33_11705 [Lacisediminihabitans profunda]